MVEHEVQGTLGMTSRSVLWKRKLTFLSDETCCTGQGFGRTSAAKGAGRQADWWAELTSHAGLQVCEP
jgi:hypothetical protein